MNMKRKEGITLIALVITIIVLLILAGVSIAMLTGQNGILSQAQNAKNKTELSSEKEQIKLAVQASITKNPDTLEITKTNLEEGIQEQLGNNREFETTDNQDGSFIVNLKNPDKMYYVEETGKVIAEENMLKISTADELKAFRDNVNNGNTYEGWYVYLANDITLDINEEWEPIGLYLNSNTSITDETNKPFSGIFDGNGFEIDGMKISSKEKGRGLFGLAKNATIKNLGMGTNCNINTGVVSGAIVGYSNSKTIIKNCFNKSKVLSNNVQVGGIAGQNGPDCYIINCYNLGTISALSSIGGIVGENFGNIYECYNSEDISSDTTNVGGIAGVNQGNITNCYNTNSIKGTGTNVGGIVGFQSGKNTKISNSYNIGRIVSSNNIGGIIGTKLEGNIKNSYYLENTVNGANDRETINGVTAKTSEELKAIASVLGSAFKQDTNNINNGYPILTWQ